MAECVIQTRQLTRYYGPKCAVDRLDLGVPPGCVFGLLGRNGSGKTTTIRMLLGLLEPTRGAASVLGRDSCRLRAADRARIGYLAEGHRLYGWMTVKQCEQFQSSFYSSWNTNLFRAVVDYFNLAPDIRVKDLSRGERAGVCLALTLAPEPELLILDDPAMGLDPVARRALLELMIHATRRKNRTILFSTHLLSDVERVADRIAVIDHATLRANCALESFRRQVRQVVLRYNQAAPELADIRGVLRSFRTDHEINLILVDADGAAQEQLAASGADEIEAVPISMEDAMICYLGDRGERSFFVQEAGE